MFCTDCFKEKKRNIDGAAKRDIKEGFCPTSNNKTRKCKKHNITLKPIKK